MRRIALLACQLLAAGAAPADVLRIPLGAQGSAASAAGLPSRGEPESAVLARYGEPATRHAPVGEPPIERWDYADFSVYFESGRVLHAVLRHVQEHPPGAGSP